MAETFLESKEVTTTDSTGGCPDYEACREAGDCLRNCETGPGAHLEVQTQIGSLMLEQFATENPATLYS